MRKQYKVISIFAFGFMSMFAWGQDRPNILWITIEDTSPQFIGCYGNDQASTPNVDQLASEGTRFINAFSTGTVCSPSRSAIITGVPTFKLGTGNHRSNYPIPKMIHGFPFYLREAGYYTSNNSKTDYNVADAKNMIAESWDESSNEAGWWKRDDNEPFFSVFNFAESHQSRTMSMPFNWYEKNVYQHLDSSEIIADDEFSMPPFYNDTPEMRKQYARVYNSIKLMDKRVGDLLERLKEDELLENTIIFFFADHGEGIPRGKTNGINLGYRVPFIVKFPEKYKHLSPWDNIEDELVSFEDLAPTIIDLVGGEVPDYMEGRILLGENRSPARDFLFLSSDRADNGIDMTRTVTDGNFIYSRNFMPFMPEMRYIRYVEIAEITQAMRKDQSDGNLNDLQESLFHKRVPEVLYEISEDPWEINNLVGNSSHQETLKVMRTELKSNMLKSRDAHLIPEYYISEISKESNPFEYRLNSKNFEIESVLQSALLTGMQDSTSISQMMINVLHPDPFVSYWAGIALLSIPNESIQNEEAVLKRAMNHPSPLTKITASFLMYKHFNSLEAIDELNHYINHEDPDLSLHTLNLLLYTNRKDAFVDSVLDLYKQGDRIYKVNAAALDFLTHLDLVDKSKQN